MKPRSLSTTAVKVARTVVYLAQDPETASVLPAGAGEWTERLLLNAGLLSPRMLRLYRLPLVRTLVSRIDEWTAPGLTLHFGVRKRYLDDHTRQALAAGARQVLCVGAGFDTLCLRLAREICGVRFVEVDHPGTSSRKLDALRKMGAESPNLQLVGVDLAESPLKSTLARVDWETRALSVVLAEGVLMYLPEPAVTAFLEAVRDHTGSGSWLLFTHLVPGPDGRVWLGRLSAWAAPLFRIMGEPFRWWVAREGLGEFLGRHGYRLEAAPSPEELCRLYCPEGRLADIDMLAVART